MANLAYLGRPFVPVYNSQKQIEKLRLDKSCPLLLDYSKKQHTFVVAKSGAGKSYLAGVIAEELVRVMENYAVVLIDPMGIFSTLTIPNENAGELDSWNEQVPGDVTPGAVGRCTTWVPAGDQDKFLPGTFDRTFSLRAAEFSYGTLCYAFDLDFLEPQVNLYRKAQACLLQKNPSYTLRDLVDHVRDDGPDMHFHAGTIEALITKLDALSELGIITNDAPEFHEMIQDRAVAVFDCSQSSTYASRILVNFLAEKLLSLRRQITRMVLRAKVQEQKIDKPRWYVPPVQMLIDEAHNFLQKSNVLKKVIKEGRNCGVAITAISQSPDLTRDVYANITHVFVGSLVYDDDIASVRAMLPIEQPPKEFKKSVHRLQKGWFLYYNVDEKTEQLIMVRPRRTMHPASTQLEDERQYFNMERGSNGHYMLKFAKPYTKLKLPVFSTIRVGSKPVSEGDMVHVVHPDGSTHPAKVVLKHEQPLDALPDEFLMADTDAPNRGEAIKQLQQYYPHLRPDQKVMVLRVAYIDQPGAMA